MNLKARQRRSFSPLINYSPFSFNNENEKFNKSIEFFVSNSKAKFSAFNGWFESVRLTFIQLDTPLTNFQYLIWLRFIASKDLYGFPLIIASDAFA